MKYFTREELEDITNKLIENPTRETLKSLNDTYNGDSSMQQELVNDNLVFNTASVVDSLPDVSVPLQNDVVNEVLPNASLNAQVISSVPEVVEIPVVNDLPNLNIPSMEIPNAQSMVNNDINNSVEVPSFELPKLETPVFNNQNNEPVNFSGNLFEQPMSNMGNLMQTTDNFNAIPNAMSNTEVSVAQAPFFGVSNEPINNPIPVEGPVNNVQNIGPSMFGEMQQNYM